MVFNRPNREPIITNLTTNDRGWKDKFLFVKVSLLDKDSSISSKWVIPGECLYLLTFLVLITKNFGVYKLLFCFCRLFSSYDNFGSPQFSWGCFYPVQLEEQVF